MWTYMDERSTVNVWKNPMHLDTEIVEKMYLMHNLQFFYKDNWWKHTEFDYLVIDMCGRRFQRIPHKIQ